MSLREPKYVHFRGSSVHHDLMPDEGRTACGMFLEDGDEFSHVPDKDWPDFPQCKRCYRAVG